MAVINLVAMDIKGLWGIESYSLNIYPHISLVIFSFVSLSIFRYLLLL